MGGTQSTDVHGFTTQHNEEKYEIKKRERENTDLSNISKKLKDFNDIELIDGVKERNPNLEQKMIEEIVERKYILGEQQDDDSDENLKIFHGILVENLLPVVLKVITKKIETIGVANETLILKKLRHRNILNIIDYYETKEKICAVFESFQKNSLIPWIIYTHNQSFSENLIQKISCDILNGLQYLHSMGIIHRNLKPENIVVYEFNSPTVFKITDFKCAKHLSFETEGIDLNNSQALKNYDSVVNVIGTIAYLAPEQVEIYKNSKKLGYGPMVDMWGFACILFELCYGFHPFEISILDGKIETPIEDTTETSDTDCLSIFDRILTANFEKEFEEYDNISHSIRQMLESLFQVHPFNRLTALEALNSDFLKASLSEEHNQNAFENLKILEIHHNSNKQMFKLIGENIIEKPLFSVGTKVEDNNSEDDEQPYTVKRQPRSRISPLRRTKTP